MENPSVLTMWKYSLLVRLSLCAVSCSGSRLMKVIIPKKKKNVCLQLNSKKFHPIVCVCVCVSVSSSEAPHHSVPLSSLGFDDL